MSEDKDLDLGDAGELSLGDDAPMESAPADEGLDLSMDEGLELGGDDDFNAAPAEEIEETLDSSELTSLKIGDDVNLDDDVMAKLAEIDEIMEADATSAALKRPDALLSGKESGTNPGLDLGGDEELIAATQSEESIDDVGLDLVGDESEGEDLLASPMLEDSDLDANALTDPGMLDGPELGALEDDDVDLFAAPEASSPKKTLPKAPQLEADLGEDEEEGLDFGIVDSSPIIEAPKKADRTAELKVPEGFGKKQAPVEEIYREEIVRSRSKVEERSSYKEVVGNYNHELERLQATLNHLRADREDLLKKIEALEEDKLIHGRHVLGMRAELDEKKIEVQLLKKRMSEETQDLKYQFELEQERRKLSEERAKAYQAEASTLQQKVRLEVKKVSSREKELEQKLELLKADAETQIRHRDLKILELKRRIDSLEFDMDAMNSIEQKNAGDKQELEGKLDKAIKTLRTAIGILETDDPKLATLEKLKKNLEV